LPDKPSSPPAGPPPAAQFSSIADGAAFGEDRSQVAPGALIAPAVEVALSKQLTQAQISGFLSDLSGGMAHARALARAGMPWGAFNRRMQSDPEFREAYTAAITIRDHRLKAESVDRMIHLGLRGVVRNVVQGGVVVDTQVDYSEKLLCKLVDKVAPEFRDKLEVSGEMVRVIRSNVPLPPNCDRTAGKGQKPRRESDDEDTE
jgi:hypothetical protein